MSIKPKRGRLFSCIPAAFVALAAQFMAAEPPEPSMDSAATPPSYPDILLIMIDSLRYDFVGCYGQSRPTTPCIDALAASGTRFEQAIVSGPWVHPSIMTAFTSLPPEKHGLFLPNSPCSTNITTLAESLRKAGYQTIGITAHPTTHRRYGYARGFEFYDDFTIVMEPSEEGGKTSNNSANQVGTGATVTRLGEGWLSRRDPKCPLFLFLFYMDPHWDYLPPPPYDRMFTDDPVPPIRDILRLGRQFVPPAARERVKAAYAGEVRYADSCVDRLLESLDKTQRGSNTIIVLTSGHGESFWERGLASHANNLHDEEIRVPLIVQAPGHSRAGSVVTGQVGLIDLAPTLLDLAGVKTPPDWEGISLKPLLAGGAAPDRPVVLDNRASGTHMRGVRTAGYKIIAQSPFETPLEVYDLVADPGETNNLVATPGGISSGALELIPFLRISVVDITHPVIK